MIVKIQGEIDFLNNNVCVTRFIKENVKNINEAEVHPGLIMQTVIPNGKLPLNILSLYAWMSWQFRSEHYGVAFSNIYHNQNTIYVLHNEQNNLLNLNDRLVVNKDTGYIVFSSKELEYMEKNESGSAKKLHDIKNIIKELQDNMISFMKTYYDDMELFSNDDDEKNSPPSFMYHEFKEYLKYRESFEYFLNPISYETQKVSTYFNVIEEMEKKYSKGYLDYEEWSEYLSYLEFQLENNEILSSFKDKMNFSKKALEKSLNENKYGFKKKFDENYEEEMFYEDMEDSSEFLMNEIELDEILKACFII